MPKFCPNCGAEQIAGANFCMNCGQSLKEFMTSTESQAQDVPNAVSTSKSSSPLELAREARAQKNYKVAIKYYVDAIKLGDTKAMIDLAEMCHKGRGVKQDTDKALAWYQKAANLDDAEAMVRLGKMYQYDPIVKQSFETAKQWFLKASLYGSSEALYQLALMKYCGQIENAPGDKTRQDYFNDAIKDLREAVKAGSADACLALCYIYRFDDYDSYSGVPKDVLDFAFKHLNERVAEGDAHAIYVLSRFYGYASDFGFSKIKSDEKDKIIFELKLKAAQAGEVEAMARVAASYYGGYGTVKNHQQAKLWYQRAVDAGDVDALIELEKNFGELDPYVDAFQNMSKWNEWCASIYERAEKAGSVKALFLLGYHYCEGSNPNASRGIAYYERAAAMGDRTSMKQLSDIYFKGKVVERDCQKAAEWFLKAMKVSSISRFFGSEYLRFAVLYYEGKELKQDYDMARRLFLMTQNNEEAEKYLGLMYLKGQGVRKDDRLAFKHLLEFVRRRDNSHNKLNEEDADIMFEVAQMYRQGLGVKQNEKEALKWYRKSADNGDARAKMIIDEFEKRLDTNRDALLDIFYDESKKGYVVPVLGYELTLNHWNYIRMADVNVELMKACFQAINKFQRFYVDASGIDNVISKVDDFGKRLLEKIATIGVGFCAKEGIYDVTPKILMSNEVFKLRNINGTLFPFFNDRIPLDIWKMCKENVEQSYNAIVNDAQNERDYRKQRKDNRGKLVGGGVGINGAIDGMVNAAVLNLLSGAAHGLVNAIGNIATDSKESSGKQSLYLNQETLQMYTAGIFLATKFIKLRTFFLIGVDDCYEAQTESKAIFENIRKGTLSGEEETEALLTALINDPFEPDIYRYCFNKFGKDNREWKRIAVIFRMNELI